ncbi:MAG: TetR/AcrR family transcriptional regulator [Ilumatobacter sp.]
MTPRTSQAAIASTPRRGRGRPKGTGKVDPAAIVDAALDTLADGGYRALTMRGVARSLGVSLATLQHHFPTKDTLWRAAVDHLTDEAIERRSHLELTDLAGRLATFLEQDGARPGLVAALLADRSPGGSERIAYVASRLADASADPLARMRELNTAGAIRPIDERALFALITIGVGSIAGSAEATHRAFGFDLTTDQGRHELAAGLADIIGLGVFSR